MTVRAGVTLLALVSLWLLAAGCEESASSHDETCAVTSVVDGDTIHVDCLDKSVRLLLIDTPEIAHEGGTGDERLGECYGNEATAYVASRLPKGTRVRLEAGVRDRDQYGRYLRYAWLGDELLNETLVREGYALRYRDAEDTTYRRRIEVAEDAARAAHRGLWGACDVSRG